MATIILVRGKTLPKSGTKNDLHELIDLSTATINNIVNADIDNSAAIAGSKVNPNFGSQDLIAGSSTIDGVLLSNYSVSNKTDDYEMDEEDFGHILEFEISAAKTLTLPDVDGTYDNYCVIVRNIGTALLTITPDGSDTTEVELVIPGGCVMLQWMNGDTTWRKVYSNSFIDGDFSTDIHQVGGSGSALAASTEYQALVDGEVVFIGTASSDNGRGQIDTGISTGVLVRKAGNTAGASGYPVSANKTIAKDEFWEVTSTDLSSLAIYFKPKQ